MKSGESAAAPAALAPAALAGAVLLFGVWPTELARRIGGAWLGEAASWTVTSEVFEFPKITLLKLLAVAGVGWFLARWAGRGVLWPRGAFAPAVGLHVLAITVAALFSSCAYASWDGTLESFWGVPTYVALAILSLLAFARWARPDAAAASEVRRLLVVGAGTSGVAALYAMAQWLGLDPLNWNAATTQGGRIFGTLGNANFLAGTLTIFFPTTLLFAMETRGGRRVRWAALASFLALVTVLSQSRGGWIGLVAGGAASMALRIAFVGGGRVVRGAVLACAILAALVAAVAFTRNPLNPRPEVMRERLNTMTDFSRLVSGTPRTYIWLSAWDMFRAHPLLGVGPDAFQQNFQRYRRVEYWRLEWHGTPTRAHNDYLHLAATTGALGLGTFLGVAVLALLAAWRAGRAARSRGDPPSALVSAAVGAGLVVSLVESAFEFAVAATAISFWLLAAAAAALAVRSRELRGWELRLPGSAWIRRAAVVGAFGVAAAVGWSGVVRPYLADVKYARGVRLQAAGELSKAVAALMGALRWAPHQEMYWVKLGLCYEDVQRYAEDPKRKKEGAESALVAYLRARELCPLNGYNANNIARVLRASGERDAALDWTAIACDADPFNAYFWLDRASLLLALHRRSDALESYARVRGMYPDLAHPHAYEGYVHLVDGRPAEAVDSFRAALGCDWHGDTTEQSRAWGNLGVALQETSDLRGAADALRRAVELDPSYTDGRYNYARVLEAQGDRAAARRQLEAALAEDPDHARSRAAFVRLARR